MVDHPGVSPSPFQVYGSEQQKMDILPSFVTGEKVGSCTSLVEVRDDPTFTGTQALFILI